MIFLLLSRFPQGWFPQAVFVQVTVITTEFSEWKQILGGKKEKRIKRVIMGQLCLSTFTCYIYFKKKIPFLKGYICFTHWQSTSHFLVGVRWVREVTADWHLHRVELLIYGWKQEEKRFLELFLLPERSPHGMKWELEEMSKSKAKQCYDNECLQSIFWCSTHMQIMKSLMSHHEAWGTIHNGLMRTPILYLCEMN